MVRRRIVVALSVSRSRAHGILGGISLSLRMTIFIMVASWAGGVENGNFGVAALLRVSRGSILAVAGQLGVYSVDWTGAAYFVNKG